MIKVIQFVVIFILLLIVLPIILIAGILVFFESKEIPFFLQERIGKNNKIFYLYKIKTVKSKKNFRDYGIAFNSQKRILKIGSFLRKYKIDELPQILNILKGDMNILGFRPDIVEYSNYYMNSNLISIKPGLLSPASLILREENNILSTKPKELTVKETYLKIIDFKIKFDSYFFIKSNVYFFILLVFNTILIIFFSNNKLFLPIKNNKLRVFLIPNNWNKFNKLVLDFKNFK